MPWKSNISVSIRQLITELGELLALTVVAGESGLSRQIATSRLQKPGLALTGYVSPMHRGRLVIFGGTEIEYMMTVPKRDLDLGVRTVLNSEPAAILVTRGLPPPAALTQPCEQSGVCLLRSELPTGDVIVELTHYLQDHLAPSTSVHGVLVDVLGIGVLLLGKSGIGKSEIALDLVSRGHRLVADDVVHLHRRSSNLVYGTGAGLIRHHMEVRGLGIINIKDLFGIASVRDTKRIELVVELNEWDANTEYDRLGLSDDYYEVLDVRLPMLHLPVRPGRSMATIIEVAARNQLLKLQGHHSARQFQERLDRAIAAARHYDSDIDLIE